MFEDGLKLCRLHDQEEQLHYFLHHLGRLKAEQLDEAGARARFTEAMIERQRRQLDLLAETSGTALAGLRTWIDSQQPLTR